MGNVASFKCSLRNRSDPGGLAEGFDERAVFVQTRIENSEYVVRRIETIAARSAKK